ncbi:MAG TPA: hotdog fold thioesterase [Coxiellaceae bacterium]|nr:MAG: thioesterase [Gammaproteobacteria bacterium RIFCSPHIGHO2_12_FULL_36_30]HLB56356.1 hotdog fold thioesterase [Coxiellaceae bacterium]
MSIWKMPITLPLITERSKNTFVEFVGIIFTEIGDDYLKATLPVDHRTKQPLGLLNGGVSAALAESVASTAANYCVDQSICYCVGLEINANHLRPAVSGIVTATAKPLHLGNKTQVWEIKIENEAGKLVCVSRMTMAVVNRVK